LALVSTVGYIIATTFFPALSLSSFYPKKEIFSAHDKIQKFQKFQKFQKDKNFDFDPFDCWSPKGCAREWRRNLWCGSWGMF
jgi:hypothetical protein